MAGGGVACCCCNCRELARYIACDAITIPGFTRVGPWQNLGGEHQASCCYQAFFTADDCQTIELCQECPNPCLPSCDSPGMLRVSETRHGYYVVSALGCVREVLIYRHFYGADEQLPVPCDPFRWCKYIVLTRWRDHRTVTGWWQVRLCETQPAWLPTCPPTCQTGCVDGITNGVRYYCRTCAGTFDWWRMRAFDDLPQGSISFSATDLVTACVPKLKCVNTDPVTGIKFYSGQQCSSSPGWNITCDCDPLQEPGFVCTEGFDCGLGDPWCINPPPTWSVTFGTPC